MSIPDSQQYAQMLDAAAEGGYASTYDPRSWGRVAEAAMADAVAERCRLPGSAGRTLAPS